MYTYLEPKIESDVPYEYIRSFLLTGREFMNCYRSRIYRLFDSTKETVLRIKGLKTIYGWVGAGGPIKGYGLYEYDTYSDRNGVTLCWIDEEGEKKGTVTWVRLVQFISELISDGEYYCVPVSLKPENMPAYLWQILNDFLSECLTEVNTILQSANCSDDEKISRICKKLFTLYTSKHCRETEVYSICAEKSGITIEFYSNKEKYIVRIGWQNYLDYLKRGE